MKELRLIVSCMLLVAGIGYVGCMAERGRWQRLRIEDVKAAIEADAQWRRDCVVAGCAVWSTAEDGSAEWKWNEREAVE